MYIYIHTHFHTLVEFVIPFAYNFGLNFAFFVADGDDGMKAGSCPSRKESPPLDDKSRSLVLVNYFRSIPMKQLSCGENSGYLINMLHACNGAAASRWANFVAVDYYKVYISFANSLTITFPLFFPEVSRSNLFLVTRGRIKKKNFPTIMFIPSFC